MPTVLSPNDGFVSDADRFTSMNVTRNADAVIRDARNQLGTRAVNSVDDIKGARPRSLPPFQRNNFHETSDIEGARPRQLHRERRETSDVKELTSRIPGDAPQACGFEARTRRHVNPLEPEYQLPSLPPVPVPAMPFKRDLHNIDDIAGTKPVVYKPYATRDSHNVDDIAGTHSVPRTFHRDINLDTMQVRDINTEGLFRSARRTDPQRPEHTVHGRVLADDDPKMYVKPRTRDARRPFLSLTTADIDGAQTHFQQEVPVGGIAPESRRHYRVTNYVSDIKGTTAGSAKRGLDSGRATNPLEAHYVLLDGRRLTAEELAVGKSWYNAAATVLAAETAEAESTMALGRSGVSVGVGPALTYAKKVLDPRDAEIAALRGAVDTLRKEREVMALTASLGRGGGSTMGGTGTGREGVAEAAGTLRYRGSHVVEAASSLPLDPSPAFTAPRASTAPQAASHARTTAAAQGGQDGQAVDRSSAGSVAGGEDAAPLSRTSSAAPSTSAATAARIAAQRGHTVQGFDPVSSLRASVTAASAKNIIGVIPTFPSATLHQAMGGSGALGGTGTMRASGRFDKGMDGDAPAARGENRFNRPPPSQQIAPPQKTNFQVSQHRAAVREKMGEVAEVRGLPDIKFR